MGEDLYYPALNLKKEYTAENFALSILLDYYNRAVALQNILSNQDKELSAKIIDLAKAIEILSTRK